MSKIEDFIVKCRCLNFMIYFGINETSFAS
jgi:hypothetical protein